MITWVVLALWRCPTHHRFAQMTYPGRQQAAALSGLRFASPLNGLAGIARMMSCGETVEFIDSSVRVLVWFVWVCVYPSEYFCYNGKNYLG